MGGGGGLDPSSPPTPPSDDDDNGLVWLNQQFYERADGQKKKKPQHLLPRI